MYVVRLNAPQRCAWQNKTKRKKKGVTDDRKKKSAKKLPVTVATKSWKQTLPNTENRKLAFIIDALYKLFQLQNYEAALPQKKIVSNFFNHFFPASNICRYKKDLKYHVTGCKRENLRHWRHTSQKEKSQTLTSQTEMWLFLLQSSKDKMQPCGCKVNFDKLKLSPQRPHSQLKIVD